MRCTGTAKKATDPSLQPVLKKIDRNTELRAILGTINIHQQRRPPGDHSWGHHKLKWSISTQTKGDNIIQVD